MPAPSLSFAAAALLFDQSIPIERAEIVTFDGHFFARVWSGDRCGTAALDGWASALISLWQTLILPFWVGRDARDLAGNLETFARAEFAHEWASAPFWMALAGVELAIWDLLGQVSGRSVAAFLCDKPRAKLPVYLASARRETARAEIEALAQAVEISAARAVEIGIGGRSGWDEKIEARDRELLQLARETWGEKTVIYADASGSFEADAAIEVGALLHEYNVAWFEEPCHWESFEATRAVAAGVQLPVAGGAHESSLARWKWLLENCALDIARPDIFRNGGLLRTLQVTQFAAQLGVSSAPHWAICKSQNAQMLSALPALHLAAALETSAPFLQWDARLPDAPAWSHSPLEIVKGALSLPKGAGWGAKYDPSIWPRAETLAASSV